MRFLKFSTLTAAMTFMVVLMLGVFSLRVLPVRGGSVPGAALNGDVNCDGSVNIGDAISIIQWQFRGGAAPCAIAQDQTVLDKLDALGNQITALQNSVGALVPTWPPKLEDMINLSGTTPAIGPDFTIYTVPAARVFIVTGITDTDPADGNDLILNNNKMLGEFKSYKSSSGFPLPSGSKIVLRNNGGGRVGSASYLVTGYLMTNP